MWKKAIGSVTGYRVHCFPGDSQKAEFVQEIYDGQQGTVVISGLKPDKKYRIGISSVSTETESKIVFLKQQLRMRNLNKVWTFYTRYKMFKLN